MDVLSFLILTAGIALGIGVWLGTLIAGRRASGAASGDQASTEGALMPDEAAVTAGVGPDAPAHATPRLGPDGRTVAGLVGAGILHVTPDLMIDEANLAAGVLLGRPRGTLVGRTIMEAFLDGRVEALVAAAPDEGAASEELTLRDGEIRELVVRVRRAPSGGTWLVLEDVSELRRLQRIRSEFIDNLSHELRTPLTNVGLLAETLVREVDAAGEAVPPRVRDRVGKIEVETGHLVQMVNEMLDLSRIESGGPISLIDEVDPVALATAATDRLRVFAERQGVALAVVAPDPVARVRGDEDRLGQVLVNLLHNAVKFSPDGGDVTVGVRERDGEVVIAVEDHGLGIPAAAQARVFERFYKVDRARVRGGGTGLGLSIARHIVEAHGGRIELVSQEGRGSTFSVVLPVATDVEGGAAAPAGGPHPAADEG